MVTETTRLFLGVNLIILSQFFSFDFETFLVPDVDVGFNRVETTGTETETPCVRTQTDKVVDKGQTGRERVGPFTTPPNSLSDTPLVSSCPPQTPSDKVRKVGPGWVVREEFSFRYFLFISRRGPRRGDRTVMYLREDTGVPIHTPLHVVETWTKPVPPGVLESYNLNLLESPVDFVVRVKCVLF